MRFVYFELLPNVCPFIWIHHQSTFFLFVLDFRFLTASNSLPGPSACVNVHFENKDGGFFLKQSPRQQHLQPPTPESSSGGPDSGTTLSVDRFTVFQSSQPISVRATYGPFSTKQTVPARYVVPDPVPLNASGECRSGVPVVTVSSVFFGNFVCF